jgi:pyruvate ferredoxin oxidoreductase alpha subunit
LKRRMSLEGSEAVAMAVKLADVDLIAAYPITPQTHIVEILSRYVANGDLSSEFMNVESEHSALSACIGGAAVGSRVFTATSSQGLALMHEILYITSGFRLPIVMAVSNRALSAPLNINCDHSDSMAERDSGWIQIYVEDCQEAFDSTLQAFKIAEDERVLLPVMICLDGFILSHVIEAVEVLEKTDVAKFLHPWKPKYTLNPNQPLTMGAWTSPGYYMEFKRQQEEAMTNAKEAIKEVNKQYGKTFGRKYGDGLIETLKVEDADVVLVTLGSMTGVARVAVEKLREEGKAVGLLRIRCVRPFPSEEIRKALEHAKVVAIVSRDISLGASGGAALSEVRSAFFELKKKPHITGFVIGLGGRDIKVEDFITIAEKTYGILEKGHIEKDFEFIGLEE